MSVAAIGNTVDIFKTSFVIVLNCASVPLNTFFTSAIELSKSIANFTGTIIVADAAIAPPNTFADPLRISALFCRNFST